MKIWVVLARWTGGGLEGDAIDIAAGNTANAARLKMLADLRVIYDGYGEGGASFEDFLDNFVEINDPVEVEVVQEVATERFYNFTAQRWEAQCAERRHGAWYIRMGFAGFNCRAHNLEGYDTKQQAEDRCLYYQDKGTASRKLAG